MQRQPTIARMSTLMIALSLLIPATLAGQVSEEPGTRALEDHQTAYPKPILGDVDRNCVVDVNDLNLVLAHNPAGDLNGDHEVDNIDVDMLLAVWGSTCGTRLIGDADGDGRVNVDDLLSVIGDWGTATPQSDFNQDGTVDETDQAMVEANWGAILGRRLLGDHDGDDLVGVDDQLLVLANWDELNGQLELDLLLAQ